MANVILRPDWHVPERLVTPESVYLKRRDFLKQMGMVGAVSSLTGGLALGADTADEGKLGNTAVDSKDLSKLYPGRRNREFDLAPSLMQLQTSEQMATTYNNFYEFSTVKDRVHRLVGGFVTDPWQIEITGLVERPFKGDIRELLSEFPVEERIYRFRCVEAWSMVMPWSGFPLELLLAKVRPKPQARFVRFATALRPREMPGIARLSSYPWPYIEGLRLDEAVHPLTFMATGMYGKQIPKQNGAPVRLVVPWKYGYKSIKSIDRIELTTVQPKTLWESLAPNEYPFESNVNPNVPHPRWSQATERVLGTNSRVPTLMYNGYGAQVGRLYAA
jgi:sulfoxide reductase catalytic subunit YedY